MPPLAVQIQGLVPVSIPDVQRAQVGRLREALRVRERRVEVRGTEGAVAMPDLVLELLRRVVDILASGNAVTIVPVGRELTTQQAAGILNVSRQYLVRLLEDGKLPFVRTGSHRRLRIEDVLRYKERRDRERETGLTELTQLHESIGGYDD